MQRREGDEKLIIEFIWPYSCVKTSHLLHFCSVYSVCTVVAIVSNVHSI